ncbi:MAG: hypothetical protein LBI65_02915, partial [Candidatus Symbiothrix sp.]|nr:hypothetical protein [Candidatus Symbiothrix sp.]
MALSFRKQPRENYLANNPIVFELLAEDSTELINYNLQLDETDIYSGMVYPFGKGTDFYARIEVSDILKSKINPYETEKSDDVLKSVSGSYQTLHITFYQESTTLNATARIYRGGISKKMLRQLNENNTDIFSDRLLNRGKPFLLTSRTASGNIMMKRSELAPVYFIASGGNYKIAADNGYELTAPNLTAGNVYAFDLSHEKFDGASFLQFFIDNNPVCSITVLEPAAVPFRFLLSFLNSFEVYEKIEITGKAFFEPEPEETEGYSVYDDRIDDYVEMRDRINFRETVNAETGYKTLEEFLF